MPTDWNLYAAETETDGAGNGGRESNRKLTSALLNDLMPSVSEEERDAGGSRLRKLFFHYETLDSVVLANFRAMIQALSTGEDHYVLIEGTLTNTQGDLAGTEKQYGSGTLNALAGTGTSTVVVNFDDADDVDLADGDMLWLYDSVGGNQMFNTIDTGGVSWNGNQATITLVNVLNADYPQGAICGMVLDPGDVETSFDTWVENGTFTYDETNFPPVLQNKGTVRDDWTLTFDTDLGGGVMGFTVTGLYEGNVGTGRTDQDFSPSNAAKSQPYFTLDKDGWGGSPGIGDTLNFKTYPASRAVWLKEIWPAGTAYLQVNDMDMRFYGE